LWQLRQWYAERFTNRMKIVLQGFKFYEKICQGTAIFIKVVPDIFFLIYMPSWLTSG